MGAVLWNPIIFHFLVCFLLISKLVRFYYLWITQLFVIFYWAVSFSIRWFMSNWFYRFTSAVVSPLLKDVGVSLFVCYWVPELWISHLSYCWIICTYQLHSMRSPSQLWGTIFLFKYFLLLSVRFVGFLLIWMWIIRNSLMKHGVFQHLRRLHSFHASMIHYIINHGTNVSYLILDFNVIHHIFQLMVQALVSNEYLHTWWLYKSIKNCISWTIYTVAYALLEWM